MEMFVELKVDGNFEIVNGLTSALSLAKKLDFPVRINFYAFHINVYPTSDLKDLATQLQAEDKKFKEEFPSFTQENMELFGQLFGGKK